MTLEIAARASGYLTLGLATVGLACADATFVPLLPIVLPVALALFAVAFLADGRGWVLPPWGANLAGLLIVAALTLGLTAYLLRSSGAAGVERPLALLLLPYAGPLLLALALVKAFRPKTATDLWALQGLGLLMTALACVLADRGPFGLLLLAYVVCGTWHLALAYLSREARRAARPGAVAVLPWPALGVPRAVRWVLAAALLALPPFLLAPRAGERPWSPLMIAGPLAPRSADVGLSDSIDLNRTETLDPTDDVAVRVEAFRDPNATERKTDLPRSQRWRGTTLDWYVYGRWEPMRSLAGSSFGVDVMSQARAPSPLSAPTRRLPDLGSGQFFLDFTVWPKKGGALVLAEPVVLRGRGLPVITAPGPGATRALFQEAAGSVVPLPHDRAEMRYRQVVPPAPDSDLSDPITVSPIYASLVVQQPVAPLRTWTQTLALRLAGQPGSSLRPEDLEPARAPGGWETRREPERVARALAGYLATSGDYRYSFEQDRADADLDPTFDFLVNVRHGPCTRFASALALMLRSLGVPARVVLGFRGCEPLGDGRYQILASQAHAWVEVLVARVGPEGMSQWHWLSLDPTPSSEAVPRPSFSLARWWEKHSDDGAVLWRDYVVDYNPGRQESEVLEPLGGALGQAGQSLAGGPPAGLVMATAGMLAAIGLGVSYRAWRQRRRPPVARLGTCVPFYGRLLRVLAKSHQLRPRPAQTPREFAGEAGRLLRQQDGTAPVADVPARVAELFYRVAYGGRPLSDDEVRAVECGLDALAAAR